MVININKDLDDRFAQLKEYSDRMENDQLTKNIYNLNLSDEYLSKLPVNKLGYIHIKLHNAVAFKRPFKPLSQIKEVHDRLIKFLPNHQIYDIIDKS